MADEFPNRPDSRRDLARTHTRLCGLPRETSRLKAAEAAGPAAVGLLRPPTERHPDEPDGRADCTTAPAGGRGRRPPAARVLAQCSLLAGAGELAESYADRAMARLRAAVRHGLTSRP